jgi:hypothetical protein
VAEQKLFVIYLEQRMRASQGTFHANPDYDLWCGWSEMQRDLTEIKEPAAEIRRSRGSGGQGDGPEAQRVGAKIKAGAAAPLRQGPSGLCFRPPGPLRSARKARFPRCSA